MFDRLYRAALICLVFFVAAGGGVVSAQAQTKSLKLYYIHTGEKATITYKKNGKYLASGLKKINWHLRDWRRNEPTKMDPKLLDLVWEVYRRSGSKAYITVISGYRSPASNNLLRKRGRGVAKNSQHTKGRALDFFLPDVKLAKLREIGLKMGVGGVGYYPKSGSPFVHLDVGNVRHWPRMSRRELARMFPDGKTMHVPTDGKPLARYEQAVAEYKRKSATGKLIPEAKPTLKELNLFQRLARNTRDDEDDDAGNDAATAPRAVATSTTVVTTRPETAPAPEPVEPVAASRGSEFAALPSVVPIPVLPPRNEILTAGEAITVAALPSEDNASEDQVTTAQSDPDPASVDGAQEDETLTLASLNLPVPVRRPQIETPASEAAPEEVRPQTEQPATSLLALRDTDTQDADRIQVAALTPEEIEDLRASVRPVLPDAPSASALTAPVPAAEIPSVVSQEPGPVESPDIAVNNNKPVEVAEVPEEPATEPVMEVASLPVPVASPATDQPENSIQTDESEKTADTERPEPLEPVGIEPGTRSTGDIAVPTPNPNANNTILASASIPAEEEVSDLAGLPVPAPSPRATLDTVLQDEEIVTANLDAEPVSEDVASASESLPRRTISLDAYSAPRVNSSSIGQWALSTEHTIQELAEVQAPAYGRNLIRQVPETILVQGFNLQPFGPGRNNFSGKAVTATRFARLALK